MKSIMQKIVFFIAISMFIALSSAKVIASGTTSSESGPGQVRVSADGETIYLTTRVNDRDRTYVNDAGSRVMLANYSRALGEPIYKPEGFAENIGSYINSLLSIVMVVALLLAFFYFILAGFQWITSGGDRSKTEEARNKIVNAFVGILIVASTFALVSLVAYILGFESVNDALNNVRRINPA